MSEQTNRTGGLFLADRFGPAWWLGLPALLLSASYMLAASAGVSVEMLLIAGVLGWSVFHIGTLIAWSSKMPTGYSETFVTTAYVSLLIAAYLCVGMDLSRPGFQWRYYITFPLIWLVLNLLMGLIAAFIGTNDNFRNHAKQRPLFPGLLALIMWLAFPPFILANGWDFGFPACFFFAAIMFAACIAR